MVRFLIETNETGKVANSVKVANRTTEISWFALSETTYAVTVLCISGLYTEKLQRLACSRQSDYSLESEHLRFPRLSPVSPMSPMSAMSPM